MVCMHKRVLPLTDDSMKDWIMNFGVLINSEVLTFANMEKARHAKFRWGRDFV